jgi:hypothetical protein
MSDHLMRLIPADPSYVPSGEAQGRAIALLREFAPRANVVEAQVSEEIQFIDCGGNWSGVACPGCGADLEEWFWDELGRARKRSGYRDLSVVTPCCGAVSSLRDLRYGWAVGFARFVLEATNANLGGRLEPAQLSALQEALGCRLVLVLCRL